MDARTIATERSAKAFTEWQRRYRDKPDGFLSDEDVAALTVDDYGHRCAATLVRLLDEIPVEDAADDEI